MPDNVVGETNNPISSALGHLGEAFCFGLIFEGVGREVDAFKSLLVTREIPNAKAELLTRSVNVGFNNDVHATNTV